MTIPEAKTYLVKLSAKFDDDEEMACIFSTIWTSPGRLKNLYDKVCVKNVPLKQHVSNVLHAVRIDFKNFPLRPILKALQEHPNGVSLDYFDGQKYEGVELSSPDAVFRALTSVVDGKENKKQNNVLVYRANLAMYQLSNVYSTQDRFEKLQIPSFAR